MQCTRCGEPPIYGERRCWHCGALVDEERPSPRRMVAGLPVLPDDPPSLGPPGGRADWGMVGSSDTDLALPRVARSRPLAAPSPPAPAPPSWRGYRKGVALAALALCLVLGGAMLVTHREIVARAFRVPTTIGATAPAPRCPVPVVNTAAASALSQVRMATGVRDLAHHDYRPIDNVRHFRSEQEAFLTFAVATKHAGTVDVAFCTAGRRVTGSLAVPANAAGRYATFSLQLEDIDVGPAMAVLRWDGAVAGAMTLVVTG